MYTCIGVSLHNSVTCKINPFNKKLKRKGIEKMKTEVSTMVICAMVISLQISQWSFLYIYKLDECIVPSPAG